METMAEVAEVKSSLRVWQLPAGERGVPPKDGLYAENSTFWGRAEYARNCHRKMESRPGEKAFRRPVSL